MLRGVKPTKVEKRLKALFYGSAGVGKTTAAINFPRPYLIDTEKGAVNDGYIEILEAGGGNVFQTSDFDDLISEVKALLTTKHEFKTLIIDPMTIVYNDLLDKAAEKVGTEFGRHYGEANKKMKHLCNLLLRLDMNVIITTHAKNEYGTNLSVLGQTYDCYKKLDYIFDLVFEIQKRGTDRVGVVKKTRVKTFADNESFPFSYEDIAEKYGKDCLEKDAVAEVLASEEQINEINRLIELLKVDDETVKKWLKKAESDTFEEMNSNIIEKCIKALKDKIESN
jgi:DNA polymerase III delta prime subunit